MNIPSQQCLHYKTCSGCSLDLTVPYPPIWEDCCRYFSSKHIPQPQLHQGPPLHWRNRAKLAVRGTSNHVQIGLFKAHSHEVIPIPFCKIHDPTINAALTQIKKWIQTFQITPYDEKNHTGELRYLQLVVERATGKVQLTFVLNRYDPTKWKTILAAMQADSSLWHSVWINVNPQKTNTIFGDQWHLCFGSELLWETFLGTKVCFHPASFAQANLPLFEKMLTNIRSRITKDSKIIEFYAGVGAIGLSLAPFCQSISCVEINPHAEACFLKSKEQIPNASDRISFFSGPSESYLHLLEEADTVIVDPPRKGLCSGVLNALKSCSTIQQLIYISCGWESFQSDCDALLAAGWTIETTSGYWFFPGSNQIETLAILKKK